jgi:hypothetical protein
MKNAILQVELIPVRYSVGQIVTLTQASFDNVWNASRSVELYPSSEFVEKLRPYIGKNATVTHVFPPGYEMSIQFEDGKAFHAKDSWVQAASLLSVVKVFLADGSDYETNVNAKASDAEIVNYFVGQSFNRGVYPQEKLVKCVRVSIMR